MRELVWDAVTKLCSFGFWTFGTFWTLRTGGRSPRGSQSASPSLLSAKSANKFQQISRKSFASRRSLTAKSCPGIKKTKHTTPLLSPAYQIAARGKQIFKTKGSNSLGKFRQRKEPTPPKRLFSTKDPNPRNEKNQKYLREKNKSCGKNSPAEKPSCFPYKKLRKNQLPLKNQIRGTIITKSREKNLDSPAETQTASHTKGQRKSEFILYCTVHYIYACVHANRTGTPLSPKFIYINLERATDR
jgi:hypothetical protein